MSIKINLKPYLPFALPFLGILIIFFALRLINLNGLPVFVDEAIYIRWSQIMKNEATLRFLPQSDGKQPLFMWLLMPVFNYVSDPLIAGRLLSVFSGLGTLLGLATFTFLITQSLKLSIISSLIYAISPYTVFFDRLSLVDSLLAMFGIWSLIIGFLFVKKPRLDLSLILGFIIGAGLLTKSPAVFFYFWQPLLALFFFKLQKNNKLKSFLPLLSGWFVTFIVSQIIYNILRLGPNFHLIGSRNQDYLFPLSEVLLKHPLNPLTGNLKSTLYWLVSLFTPLTIVLIILSFLNKKNIKLSLSLLSLSFLPLFAQSLIAKVYTPRYLLFAIMPLIILTSLGFNWLENSFKKLKPVFLYALFLFPLIISFRYILIPEAVNMPRRMRHGYLEEWTAGWGQKDLANYLKDLNQQGHTIVVGTEGYFGTLPEGLQIYLENLPNITVLGVGQPIVFMPEALLNTSPDNLIFLVVNQSRNLLPEHELKKLELLKSYPKPIRPDGTRESLLVYKFIQQP